jgi:hypothetical protein
LISWARNRGFRLSKSQKIKIASGVYGYPGEHDGSAECVDLTLQATRRRSADASGSFIDFVAERLLECAPNCLAKLKAFSGRTSHKCLQPDLSRVGKPVYPWRPTALSTIRPIEPPFSSAVLADVHCGMHQPRCRRRCEHNKSHFVLLVAGSVLVMADQRRIMVPVE